MEFYIGKHGDANFEKFLKFPKELYPVDSLRLKQTEVYSKDHPSDYFLVFDKYGEVCARAVVYKNSELRYLEKPAYCIGNYECYNDPFVSRFFWKNILEYISKESIGYLIGPMNGSTWEQYKFNLSSAPFFFTEYEHCSYYLQQFEEVGFKSIASYYSHLDDGLQYDKQKAVELENSMTAKGISMRKINMDLFEEELIKVHKFCLESFKNNFLYTPVSWESFYEKYLPIKSIMNPAFVLFAEREGDVVGLFFSIHDLYSVAEKRLIVKTIARNPDEAYSGLAYVMADKVLTIARELGYTSAIHAFIHQDNKSKSFSSKFSGKSFKEYVLYGLELNKKR